MKELKLIRYPDNPILCPSERLWECCNVSNAAAVEYDGAIHLIYRAEGKDLRSNRPNAWPVTRLGHAVSYDGFTIAKRDMSPIFDRDINDPWRFYGCEDPRISKIGDTYYIVFVGMAKLGHFGDFLLYSTTRDFKSFTKPKPLMREMEQRTSGLLSGKINGEFLLYHRPMPNMWVSRSSDLEHWHDTKCIWQVEPGSWYGKKLGIGAVPVETSFGWVLFWHGKSEDSSYALGIMLLDKDDPTKIIKVQKTPVLTCEMPYEKEGFVSNVVYTTGAVHYQGKFIVYYGCCDHVLSAAYLPEEAIFEWCSGN